MFYIKKEFVSILISLVFFFSGSVHATEEIRIALRAHKGIQQGLAQWQPTADYLSEKIPGYRFVMVPFENISGLNQAVSTGEFQFCLTNPASAVEHQIRYKSTPLATLVNKRNGKGYSKFGSVIFTRADRSDIRSLQDIKGKTFIGVDEFGFGGWRVAWREFIKNDIYPYSDFKKLLFAGGKQQQVVFAVRSKRADAGVVRTDMLERMAAAGQINLSDFKVIGKKLTRGFPFLHSTDLYPEWLFSATSDVSDKLKTSVVAALYSIPGDSRAAVKGQYVSWISPLDYSSVESLLRELSVGPFNMAELNPVDHFIKHNGIAVMASLFISLLMIATIIYLARLNNRIKTTQKHLEHEVVIRERAEYVLASLAQQSLDFTKEGSFFNDCLLNLSELFNAKYAFIGLFSNPEKTRIKTYSVLAGNKFVDNFEYELEGTPCQDVLDLKEELINRDAGKRYPEDKMLIDMGIESYFGSPLISPAGKMMGLVSVMDTNPLNPDASLRPILRIFANRIALEMQRKREEDELQGMTRQLTYQASHDALTGLINRREFENRLTSAWERANNDNERHALCYIDLDQFKVVNDTCGHLAGDELLKQLANRLDGIVRGSDTLARLGGDEFGVLLLDCPMEQAQEIAQELLDTIKAFRYTWEDNVFEVGASIGLVPIDSYSHDIYQLLQAADSACYVAKDQGRNRIHIYKEDDIDVASHQGEMRWVTEITRALEENDFILYRQAIRKTDSIESSSHHYEILVRMKNTDGEILLPGSFISSAERYNLMLPIDKWVIKNSFAFIDDHYSSEELKSNEILYAINLSGITISDKNFLSFIEEELNKYEISSNAICFEITETAAITNFSQAIKFIEKMKRKGFYFALDDFGTGLCSYAYLRSLPVDYLKIDGRFVSGLFDDPMNKAIIESIVHIAKVMQVYTIAEWVENEKILDEIKQLGVHFVQGYHIGKPEEVPGSRN